MDVALRGVGATTPTSRRLRSGLFKMEIIPQILNRLEIEKISQYNFIYLTGSTRLR